MKFKVGDRVKTQSGEIGIIERVNPLGVSEEHYKISYAIKNEDGGYFYSAGLELLIEQLVTDSLYN